MSEHNEALRMVQVPVVLTEPKIIHAIAFAVEELAGYGERFGWTD